MTERLADRFESYPDEQPDDEDADDTRLFGNDEAELPGMPGHPVSTAAGRSPQAREEQASSLGMDLPQDDNPDTGGGEFNLDAVDDLKRELRADEGDNP